MEKKLTLTRLIPVITSGLLLTGATSCASLFGNPNCHCTHAGPCQCCPDGHDGRVVVAHRPVQQDTAAENPLLAELLSKDYSLVQYMPEEPKRLVWVDDSIAETVIGLQDSFKVNNGMIMPRDVTTDNTENAIYFYFTERADGTADQLRLRVQYYADDPLRFEKLHFIIDGFDYYFTPTNIKRGKGKGIMIWENSDDPLTTADKDLAYALTHCKWCQLKIMGAGGMQHVKMISDSQFNDFYNTLQMFRLKGGKL